MKGMEKGEIGQPFNPEGGRACNALGRGPVVGHRLRAIDSVSVLA